MSPIVSAPGPLFRAFLELYPALLTHAIEKVGSPGTASESTTNGLSRSGSPQYGQAIRKIDSSQASAGSWAQGESSGPRPAALPIPAIASRTGGPTENCSPHDGHRVAGRAPSAAGNR